MSRRPLADVHHRRAALAARPRRPTRMRGRRPCTLQSRWYAVDAPPQVAPRSSCSGCSRCRRTPRRTPRPQVPGAPTLADLTFTSAPHSCRRPCGSPRSCRMPGRSDRAGPAPSATTGRSRSPWRRHTTSHRAARAAHPRRDGRRHVGRRPARGRGGGRAAPRPACRRASRAASSTRSRAVSRAAPESWAASLCSGRWVRVDAWAGQPAPRRAVPRGGRARSRPRVVLLLRPGSPWAGRVDLRDRRRRVRLRGLPASSALSLPL